MIRKYFVLFVVLTLVLAVIPACSDGDDGVTLGVRATGSIQGSVYDLATGKTVDGVLVTITSLPFATDATGTGEVTRTTTSNMNGEFLRTDVPNGVVEVHVSRDGYKTPDSQFWALSPGGTGDFRFDLAPGQDPIPEFEGDEQWARPPDWSTTPDDDV